MKTVLILLVFLSKAVLAPAQGISNDFASIDFNHAKIGDALRGLGEVFEKKVVIPPDLENSEQRVECVLKDVTLYQFLYVLLKDTPYSYIEADNQIIVLKREDPRIDLYLRMLHAVIRSQADKIYRLQKQTAKVAPNQSTRGDQ